MFNIKKRGINFFCAGLGAHIFLPKLGTRPFQSIAKTPHMTGTIRRRYLLWNNLTNTQDGWFHKVHSKYINTGNMLRKSKL